VPRHHERSIFFSDAALPLSTATATPFVPHFDGLWKEALQLWLPECLALFWPHIHQQIDWTTPPVFLDKELKRLDRILKHGAQHVDLLAQLRLNTGDDALLLLHLEVQAGHIHSGFVVRIFRYRIHLLEKYRDQAILSCAILLDREQGPDTATFRHGGFGDHLIFSFPVVNLAQWRHRMAKLKALAPTNPFVVVVLAQLEYRATAPDATRLVSKLRLARSLKQWNYDEATRKMLLRILDGLLLLPEPLEDQFIETLEQEDAVMMQLLTSADRVLLRREKAAGLEEGRQEGRREGKLEGASTLLETQLQRKFGSIPDWAAIRIAQADVESLRQWALNVLDAERIELVFENP